MLRFKTVGPCRVQLTELHSVCLFQFLKSTYCSGLLYAFKWTEYRKWTDEGRAFIVNTTSKKGARSQLHFVCLACTIGNARCSAAAGETGNVWLERFVCVCFLFFTFVKVLWESKLKPAECCNHRVYRVNKVVWFGVEKKKKTQQFSEIQQHLGSQSTVWNTGKCWFFQHEQSKYAWIQSRTHSAHPLRTEWSKNIFTPHCRLPPTSTWAGHHTSPPGHKSQLICRK